MSEIIRCCALLLVVLCATLPAAGAEPLASRLRVLADDHGFRLEGIERIGSEPAVSAEGDLASELRQLLAGYNYVVDGVPPSVQRVIILGAKQAAPRRLVVNTTRHQGHHMVSASLIGVAGYRASVTLLVDTGASTLVLPASMMAPLGFDGEALEEQRSQTANGTVTGRSAQLASVAVGAAVLSDVAVLFVADERLGGVSLLGMSFLDRFSISIEEAVDPAHSKLVLTPR